jgi:hypothetical protein
LSKCGDVSEESTVSIFRVEEEAGLANIKQSKLEAMPAHDNVVIQVTINR